MKLPQNNSTKILICAVILAGVIYFIFRPLILNLNSANINLKIKNTELTKKEEKLEKLNNLKSKIATYKSTLQAMQNALPKGEDLSSLLVSVESLVGSSGLGLSSFEPPVASTEKQSASASSASQPAVTAGEEATAPAPEAAVSQSVTQATSVGSSSYSLGLSGSYPSFFNFLNNVNKNIRPTVLNSIQISSSGEALKIDVKITTYYQK